MKNWIKRLFSKKSKSGWTVIEREGSKMAISPEVMEYFNSNLSKPDPSDLLALIKSTNKVVILERNIAHIEIDSYKVDYEFKTLLELDKKEEINTLGDKLEILPNSEGHVLDSGTLIFEFYTENNERHQIEYIEGSNIRWKQKWKDDGTLKDHIQLLEWLYDLGIQRPLNEYKERAIVYERFDRFYDEVPQPIINAIEERYADEYDRIYNELQEEITKERDLILKLFESYSYGKDMFQVHPVHERLPRKLLLKFKLENFNQFEGLSEFTGDQMRGVALFFTNDDVLEEKVFELDRLSYRFKTDIFNYLLEMGEEERIEKYKTLVLKES